METISNTLFWISNGLLVPVVVLLLLFFLRASPTSAGPIGMRVPISPNMGPSLMNVRERSNSFSASTS